MMSAEATVEPTGITHRDGGRNQGENRFTGSGRDGKAGMVERVAIGDVERNHPTALHARNLIIADGHRIEVERSKYCDAARSTGKCTST